MRRFCLAFALASLTAAIPAHAQYRGPDPKVSIDKLKAVDRMIGDWKGKGWIVLQSGRETFNSTETATRELDGTAVLVRGVHRSTADATRVVHNALGVIAWDQPGQRYSFRAYLATGANSEFTMTPTATGYEWGMDVGPAKIRYKATLTADSWVEDGERSMDGGKSWIPFFHMELTRTK